jgi:hypothetical protein
VEATFTDLVLLALAARAVIDAWRDGEIFAGLRARAEVLDNFFANLLSCRFCLAYHAPYLLLAAVGAATLFGGDQARDVARMVVLCLAATAACHLLEDTAGVARRIAHAQGGPESLPRANGEGVGASPEPSAGAAADDEVHSPPPTGQGDRGEVVLPP